MIGVAEHGGQRILPILPFTRKPGGGQGLLPNQHQFLPNSFLTKSQFCSDSSFYPMKHEPQEKLVLPPTQG